MNQNFVWERKVDKVNSLNLVSIRCNQSLTRLFYGRNVLYEVSHHRFLKKTPTWYDQSIWNIAVSPSDPISSPSQDCIFAKRSLRCSVVLE